jgi:hypothetical protein
MPNLTKKIVQRASSGPKHTRTEERAPVSGSEFTTKAATPQGGSAKIRSQPLCSRPWQLSAAGSLKGNDLPTDFATWSAIARDRPRWRLLTHSTPTPSPATPNHPAPSPPTPSPPKPSPPTPNQPSASPNAPLPGYGNLAPAYVAPAWYAPLAQAQYTETRAAGRAAWYASRANRANAPPQQNNLARGIALCNSKGRS